MPYSPENALFETKVDGETGGQSFCAMLSSMDINRATEVTPEVEAAVDHMFQYQPWDAAQTAKGANVREALATAVKVILGSVPPCADRSVAIRKLRDARMDCNSAITHGGKY